jgi:hypothetical protein
MAKYPHLLVMTFGSASLSEDAGHPNKMKFHGVLVRLDEPSTKPPNGSNGHRILVPSSVAKRVIKSLINMGLNYSPSLEAHAQKRKVGTITKAWIDGKDLCVDAVVWKHDFPEAEQDLKQPGLGMSMEIGDVQVENENAEVWKLSDFCFLGATILWKNAAAYYRTQAIAANKEGRHSMAKKEAAVQEPVKKPVQITNRELRLLVASAAGKAVEKALGSIGPTIGRQTKILANLATRLDDVELGLSQGRIITTNADDDADDDDEEIRIDAKGGAHKADCTDKECEGCMTSAKKPEDDEDEDDEDDDDEDIDATTVGDIDKGDLDDMGPDTDSEDDPDDEPGHINKGARNKGGKVASEDKVGKHASDGGITGARLANALKANKKMARDIAELKAQVGALTKTVKRQVKQIAAAGEQNRRSVDPSTLALLSKSGIDARELQASGQRMTVAEVDAVLAASGLNLGPVERMTAKNKLLQEGLMEDGAVQRG